MEIHETGGKAFGSDAVNELSKITLEREKYKRKLLYAFVLLWIIAILVPVFAPSDKTTVSFIASGALIILSFGIIGAKNFIFKAFGLNIQAGETASNTHHSKEPMSQGESAPIPHQTEE
jgi:uncharacterized membrane protein YjjP (DUF1212 family)